MGDYQPKRLFRPKRLYRPGKRLERGVRHISAGRCSAVVAAALCVLVFTGASELSTAYLYDQGKVDNTFVLGAVDPSVEETFNTGGTTKKDVSIKNGGITPVYIRAQLLIYWENAAGTSVLADKPTAGTDYTITPPESGWSPVNNGYYYYTQPVQPEESTSKLIQTLTDKNTDPSRRLRVDIIAQAVQSSPAEAVKDVFGAGVAIGADGTLTPPAATPAEPPAPGGGTT